MENNWRKEHKRASVASVQSYLQKDRGLGRGLNLSLSEFLERRRRLAANLQSSLWSYRLRELHDTSQKLGPAV
jgi:hypothetical protein